MVLEVKWEGEDSLSRPLELTLSGFKCKGKKELVCLTFHLSTGFRDVSLIFFGNGYHFLCQRVCFLS